MSRRTGLGRGLAALIPPSDRTRPSDEVDASVEECAEDTPPDEAEGEPARADATRDEPASDPATELPPSTRTEPTTMEQAPADRTVPSGQPLPTSAPGIAAAAPVPAPPVDDLGHHDEWGEAPVVGIVPPPTSGGSGEEPAASAPVPATTATYAEVAPAAIVPNPKQPREVFDLEELEGLAVSLRDVGVLQPLVVRPGRDGQYELIAGERRLRAALLAQLEVVPVLIRHTDDADLLKEALVENIHRVQLNPLEEAAAYEQLLEEFGVTQEELATRLGRSRPAISNTLRLLKLPPAVQRRIAAGVLSAGHAKALLSLDDAAAQTRLAERIVAEGLSVRATEELVRLRMLDDTEPEPRRRRKPMTAPGLLELQDDLSDALETRVRITMGARKGKLAIEFASVDDLERIVGVIANGLGGAPGDLGNAS